MFDLRIIIASILKQCLQKKYFRKDKPILKTPRQECQNLFNTLNPLWFCHYDPGIGASIELNSAYTNIVEYTKVLHEICAYVKNQRPLSTNWGYISTQSVSIDRFMVSADGYYIDVRYAVSAFQEVVLKLCKLLCIADNETFGVGEHNLRMLTKLFINLKHVGEKLIDVSLSNTK